MFDTVGSRLNFPVVAGVEETFRVSFFVGGDGLSVLGATFEAGVYVAHGDERGELVVALPVEHDARENAVLLTVPELAEGHYLWELRATDAVGKVCRLLYGTLTALSSADVVQLADAAEDAELRELVVQVAGGYGAPLMLRWQSCSVAASLAESAARAAERAEDAAERAEDAEDAVVDKLSAANAFLESFNRALYEAIRVFDDYLWVGGVNTGHYLRGADGITPHIGADGFWYVGERRLGDRPAFGKDGITPHITPDGFWAFGELKTAVRAEGRDGLDGTAVRRVLVDSYEDIPQSGETCNGGYFYYVPAGVERAQRLVASLPADADVGNYTVTGELIFSAGRTWTRRGRRLLRFGLVAGSTMSGDEPSDELLYAHLWYEVAGWWIYAGRSVDPVAQAVNKVSWWEFEELLLTPGQCRVKVVMSRVADEPRESQFEAIRVQVLPVSATEGSKVGGEDYCAWAYWGFESQELTAYDVYAWVEPSGWTRVDVNYDIATSRVYGLVKLGTDSVVRGGAPVGADAAGQMAVPLAEAALPGSMMPASAAVESAGGETFMRDGRVYVRQASMDVRGVGRTSFSQVVEDTHSVGLTEDGRFSVTPAKAFQYGVVRVGTSVPQSMGLPWIIPVGAAAEGVHNEYGQHIRGQLMNNLLVGGALRTAMKGTWLSWAPPGIDVGVLPDESNAVGLLTSRSFRQSAAEGLELVEAGADLLGGVTICETIGSGSGLVPTVGALLGYLDLNYYTKLQVYTKEETYSTAEVNSIDTKNREDAAAKYKTMAAAKSEHDALSGRIDGCVKKTSTVDEICQMSLSEYQALKVRNPKCIYLLTED